ncbi:MAG: SRPBCC family protein, partial [Solimonas sp.]
DHPVDRVWEFFGRIAEVAACLPGASLTSEPADGHVEGRIKVKVGPINTDFQGIAEVTRDEATRSGTIIGSGKDQRSNSSTRGRIGYQVKAGDRPDQTRVDVTIGYTLTGALAQFGRSGLVQDIANRLMAVFAQNLEARLAGREDGRSAATEFDAGSLVTQALIGRIKLFCKRLFMRK